MNITKLKEIKPNTAMFGRSSGELGFNKNGDSLDIWIKTSNGIDWYGVNAKKLLIFLQSKRKHMKLRVESSFGQQNQK